MRLLKLLFLLPIFANAQEVEIPAFFPDYNYNVLYRGYANRVYFGSVNGTTDYNVAVEGGTLQKMAEYSILTPTDNDLNLIFIDNKSGDTLKILNYICKALPPVSGYFGNATNGETADRDATEFTVGYGPDVFLKYDFKVTQWTMAYKGKEYRGAGNKLSGDAQDALKAAKEGDKVIFEIRYSSPDGLTRSISMSLGL